MENLKIKTATACYTGGGIYIFYGQLENGLWFRAWDECEAAYICDSDTETEEAETLEFYEAHTVKELIGDDFRNFWNAMLSHILNGGAAYGKWSNYSTDDLERRIIKPVTPPTSEQLKERIGRVLEEELGKIYGELNIETGDITPAQTLEWERMAEKIAALFNELINQNK